MVVTPDSAEAVQRANLPGRVIPDREGRLLRLLGQEVRWYRMGRLPALIAVDRSGRVAAQHWGQSMRDTPDLAKLLDQAGW